MLADVVLRIAAWSIAVGYLTAGVVRGYVAVRVLALRRDYWASVPICVLLAVTQVLLAVQGSNVTYRALMAEVGYLLLIRFALLGPAWTTMRLMKGQIAAQVPAVQEFA